MLFFLQWHLGYFKKKYTPVNRGFDSFYGFYNGKIDYYDYTNFEKYDDLAGTVSIFSLFSKEIKVLLCW